MLGEITFYNNNSKHSPIAIMVNDIYNNDYKYVTVQLYKPPTPLRKDHHVQLSAYKHIKNANL
jgi:hypothetical protein